jgi:hypothetical protein
MIETLISGGQTGVDRAALDVARDLTIPHAGWCPQGRRAEDGPIGSEYQLQETGQAAYTVRTEWNVRDSDATLILNLGNIEGGTAVTIRYASEYDRPCLIVDLDNPLPVSEIRQWIARHQVSRLNIAGPRESKHPGIYQLARDFLMKLLGDN